MPRIRLFIAVALTLSVLPLVTIAAEGEPAPETARVNLFDLIYAYGVARVEHTDIASHGPHWVWWQKDAIFTLIDENNDSWLQTPPKEDFTAVFTLKAPVKVRKVSLLAKELNRTTDFEPVKWRLETVDVGGKANSVVAEGLIEKPGTGDVALEKPVVLQNFRLTAFPVDSDGKPLENKTIRLCDLSLFADKQTAFIITAPAPYLTFDTNFYPFVTAPGNQFKMRGWKISSTGQIDEDTSGFQWRSSNPRVATVNAEGVVRTVGPGEAVIAAGLTKDIIYSVPVRVEPPAQGKADLDVDETSRETSSNGTGGKRWTTCSLARSWYSEHTY